MNPFPILTTPRLILRQLVDSDNQAIFSLRSDERVNRYIDRPKTITIEDANAFIADISARIRQHQSLYWAICLKERPELIGTACLWNYSADRMTAEVGYELSPLFHGQGLMDEALKAVMRYSFNELGFKLLEAFTHRENSSSIRLLERNEFTLEEGRKDEGFPHNAIYIRTSEEKI